jgi:inorganic triphosphatase YgiF
VGAEIELKLATSERALHQAMALPWLKKQANDSSRKQELTSVYFDTDDFALREHGVSLRVRKAGGQRLRTIKTNSSAPIAREEWETEIDRDEPKLELARDTALAPLLTGAERCELTGMLSKGKRAARKLKRAQILLAADAGGSDEEIARAVSVGGSTVYRTKRRFVEGNLERARSRIAAEE